MDEVQRLKADLEAALEHLRVIYPHGSLGSVMPTYDQTVSAREFLGDV